MNSPGISKKANSFAKKSMHTKYILGAVALAVASMGALVAVAVVGLPQELRQQASTTCTTNRCYKNAGCESAPGGCDNTNNWTCVDVPTACPGAPAVPDQTGSPVSGSSSNGGGEGGGGGAPAITGAQLRAVKCRKDPKDKHCTSSGDKWGKGGSHGSSASEPSGSTHGPSTGEPSGTGSNGSGGSGSQPYIGPQ